MPTLIGLLGTCGIIALILAARQIRAMHEEDLDQIQGTDPRLTTLLLSAGWPPVATLPPATSRQGEGHQKRPVGLLDSHCGESGNNR